MSLKVLSALTIFLCAGLCQAAMILNLQGKFKAFDEKTISIEDAHFVYILKKDALSAGQQAYFKTQRTGAAVKIAVDRLAIARVEDRKKP